MRSFPVSACALAIVLSSYVTNGFATSYLTDLSSDDTLPLTIQTFERLMPQQKTKQAQIVTTRSNTLFSQYLIPLLSFSQLIVMQTTAKKSPVFTSFTAHYPMSAMHTPYRIRIKFSQRTQPQLDEVPQLAVPAEPSLLQLSMAEELQLGLPQQSNQLTQSEKYKAGNNLDAIMLRGSKSGFHLAYRF